MFRKITHIVLALFLLVVTTGITFSMHYCGGKLVSVSINKEAKGCCDVMGGCCENKTIHFEVDDDYITPLLAEHIKIVETDILFSELFVLDFNLTSDVGNIIVLFDDSSPPPTIHTRLALLQTYIC